MITTQRQELAKKVGVKGLPVKQLTQDELGCAVGMLKEGELSVFHHQETQTTGYQLSKLGRMRYKDSFRFAKLEGKYAVDQTMIPKGYLN